MSNYIVTEIINGEVSMYNETFDTLEDIATTIADDIIAYLESDRGGQIQSEIYDIMVNNIDFDEGGLAHAEYQGVEYYIQMLAK